MAEQTRDEKLALVRKLANDPRHIRWVALKWAGTYLQGNAERIGEIELSDLDDDVTEDDDMFSAYEDQMGVIVKEIEKIGKELSEQAKVMDEGWQKRSKNALK